MSQPRHGAPIAAPIVSAAATMPACAYAPSLADDEQRENERNRHVGDAREEGRGEQGAYPWIGPQPGVAGELDH